MVIHLSDSNVVGETEATLFSTIQQGPVSFLLIIKNSGDNTTNYRLEEFDGTDWVDLGANGSDYYNTLISGQVRSFKVTSSYPQVRFQGAASGGAVLDFSLTRYTSRTSGGPLPILSL